MEQHHLINPHTGKRETPEEAHDRIKSQIHPKDYERANKRAESAAHDIKSRIAAEHPGHEVTKVYHTSKAGDTEKVTNVPATQKQDRSDIYVETKHKKTGKTMLHGKSLKISDKASKNVPSSSLGMKSSGEKANALYKEHQEKIKAKNPSLAKVKKQPHHEDISAARKEWSEKHPAAHAEIRKENAKLLHNVAHHHAAELQHKLDSGEHEHVVNHIRDVLGAEKTPAEKAGKATFAKHTTYETAKGTQHHESNPGHDYEHILKDHKNLKVKASKGSVHFYHHDPKTGKETKFASQAHKFDSQSDPLSTLKSAGKAA
jgi:hypothetical protein